VSTLIMVSGRPSDIPVIVGITLLSLICKDKNKKRV